MALDGFRFPVGRWAIGLIPLLLLFLGLVPFHPSSANADPGQEETLVVKDVPPDAPTNGGPPPAFGFSNNAKNMSEQPKEDPNGVTLSGPSPLGSKNASPMVGPQATQEVGELAGTGLTVCGAILDGGWTTTSNSFEVIRSCSLKFPTNGFVYIHATSSVGIFNSNYEARFTLGVDGNSLISTDRWVNIYTDGGDGTDKTVSISALQAVAAGAHTFDFRAARYTGTGTVQLYDPNLTVIYIPASETKVLACGVSGSTTWTTTEASFQPIRSCSLNLPTNGFVYLSADASVGLGSGGANEGRFRVGIDAVGGTASSDRWVNVYPDSGDGTDEAVATSLLTSAAAGPHTFYFSGTRYAGTGTVQLYDPTLSVIYLPAPNVMLKVCGAGGSDTWTNSTSSYAIIRSCTLRAPTSGWAFVSASASVGLNSTGPGNEFEAQFRVGVDNDTGSSLTDRWVNMYTDSGDGTDRSVAVAALVNISRGVHTFYFVGRRYAGSGTARLYSPSLAVFVPGTRTNLPLISK